jgi:hypothetical protein
MEIIQEKKDQIESHIVDIIADAIEQEKITETDLPLISNFVLEKIDTIVSKDQLLLFLTELASNWEIFRTLEVTQRGEIQKKKEEEAVQNISQLVQDGNINDAIQIAKAATQQ